MDQNENTGGGAASSQTANQESLAQRVEDKVEAAIEKVEEVAGEAVQEIEKLGEEAAGALGIGSAGNGGEAGTGAGPSDDEPNQESQTEDNGFRFELGAKVFLFERNFDPETSALVDGYQAPKPGTIAKITADTDKIDVRTGGESEPALIHHDVPYQDSADEGANYWSDTAE